MMTGESHAGIIREIAATISSYQSFLVATHIRPDGDALGSLLAMTFMLHKLGKEADAYCQDGVPPTQRFLPGSESILHNNADLGRYQVAVLVDCGDLHRVGDSLAPQLRRIPLLINIDHHVSSSPFGNLYWVDPSASSTCEMLYDLSLALALPLDTAIASQLYTGILMDTGSFRFSNTNKRVLEIMAALVGAGAQPAYIAQQVYDSDSPNRLRLLAEFLRTLCFYGDHRLATAEITQAMYAKTGTSPVDSEAFINQLRSVKPVQIAIMFREEANGVVYASLRSKDDVDVASFAGKYGGGGHRHAAALRIAGELARVRKQITEEALNYLQ
jgi:bifunctional oligoribonuclease and PAP phosphatase NrnA